MPQSQYRLKSKLWAVLSGAITLVTVPLIYLSATSTSLNKISAAVWWAYIGVGVFVGLMSIRAFFIDLMKTR